MNCNEFREMMSDYIDDEIDSYNKGLFVEHMKECKECMSEYLMFRKVIDEARELPMEELPKGYCKKLRAGLEKSKADKKKSHRIRFIKYTSAAAAFILVLSGLYFATMNKGSNYDSNFAPKYAEYKEIGYAKDSYEMPTDTKLNYSENMGMDEAAENENIADATGEEIKMSSVTGQQQTSNSQNRTSKIIKSCTIGTNTLEYDKFTNDLISLIRSENGYIEYNRTYTRYKTDVKEFKSGEIKLRIPQESFERVVSYINSDSEVYNQISNEDDVTKYYYDTENVVKNLMVQEERLRQLYSQATNITEILALEAEITRVRTDIDSYSITLSDIDDRVAMSTITLDITEIEGISIAAQPSDSMWKKATEGIVRSINNIIQGAQSFIVWLITVIPYLVIIAIVIIIITVIVKRKSKARK